LHGLADADAVAILEYTQIEAEWMIGLPKRAPVEAKMYSIVSPRRPGFCEVKFMADADPQPNPAVRFVIQTAAKFSIGAYCIQLHGRIGNRGMEGLCRYDVHNTPHANNHRCCTTPPPEIFPRQFHVHRFNECSAEHGVGWDKCATLFPIVHNDSFGLMIRDLIGCFVADMKLKFSDTGSLESLFQTGRTDDHRRI
jgi:hypothetical protein